MRRLFDKKLTWAACGAVILCGVIAAERAARTDAPGRHGEGRLSVPTLATTRSAWAPRPALPAPLPLPGEAPAQPRPPCPSTPEEQAAAGRRVSAGCLVRALVQAAAQGDVRTVDELVKGLPRYGEAAREKLEEELVRTKSPKSRDALNRALAALRS